MTNNYDITEKMYQFRVFTNGRPETIDFEIYSYSESAAWRKICDLAMDLFKPDCLTRIERLV